MSAAHALSRALRGGTRHVLRARLDALFTPVVMSTTPDPGLFGPQSMTWAVHGDPTVFLGGVRSLVVQSLHPEVAAGVDQHSSYHADPVGRLRRTAAWVTAVTFAPLDEAVEAACALAGYHAHVHGTSERGRRYSANDAGLVSWVHNTMVDSFLDAYRIYGPGCSNAEADRYVTEMVTLGELCGADALPTTAAALRDWIVTHPDIAPSAAAVRVHRFLARPPLEARTRMLYRVMFHGALASVPAPLNAWCPRPQLGAAWTATVATRVLTAALGDSRRVHQARARLARPGRGAGHTTSRT